MSEKNATQTNRERYLRSLAGEVSAQATRVRDLIGDRHWLTDGSHKEFLLAEVIRRHVPGAHLVARGFVVSPRGEVRCSREQDILIVDTSSEAPVFHQGGVVITFPETVRGAVSVKTALGKKELLDSAAVLRSTREIAVHAGVNPAHIWCGAYFFDTSDTVNHDPNHVYEYWEEALRTECLRPGALIEHCAGPDLLATSTDLLFRVYRKEGDTAKIVGFNCVGLASAVFLAHLLDHLATSRGARRSDFADFASMSTVKLLDKAEHVFTLSTERP